MSGREFGRPVWRASSLGAAGSGAENDVIKKAPWFCFDREVRLGC